MPYHIGFTCESLRNYRESKQCRFCGDVIVNEEVKHEDGDAAVFDDVCPKEECQKLVKESCDKTLPCGHACHGFFGET